MPDQYATPQHGGSDDQPPDDTAFWLPEHVALSGSRVRGGFAYVPGELLIRDEDYDQTERGFRQILDEYDFRRHTRETKKARNDRSVPPEERRDEPRIKGLVLL